MTFATLRKQKAFSRVGVDGLKITSFDVVTWMLFIFSIATVSVIVNGGSIDSSSCISGKNLGDNDVVGKEINFILIKCS